ncbi:pyridoxal phosphate-dependent aminotransferase [Capnocytophaga catalasegens]|uniref:Aminotransferase n=1 Tax=Capnocytophaga catalasegens TaxID=1004260 RepID=A0AAV5AWP2_9FLAO|nr:pyridoxal phosphate-dependent aminotransferase [Capnocytophaga catalasegens]GIZ14045.1 aminotransferase [Capnocytophaga catalasegens]GJM49042.1 aminotransferase [Capnocytophaga catalasegens]GJM52303.1 aminotransferase [Capnocytophaga catalasegens]
MNTLLSDRVNRITLSATLAMAAKTRELKAQGKDIINLSLGEPDFDVPDFIKKAAIKAIEENYSKYSPIDGFADLKDAICQKFERDNHLTYTPSQIVVSTGAKQSLANAALVLLNKGDEVILPAPYWVSYSDITKIANGIPIEVKTSIKNDFKITPEQLEAAITPQTKLLFLCSPNNPSGSIYTRSELEALATILRKYPNIFIISDEIYEYINFIGEHTSIAEIDGMYERTITINGVSKAFAMTGWRIGYMGAAQWIARACSKLQGQITSGANTIAQRATMAALQAPKSATQYMIDQFRNRRDLVLELLRQIDGFQVNEPQGAFYVFPDISSFFGKILRGKKIDTANDFSMFLLEEAGVATVTGEAFGDNQCIRLSYATSEQELREAIKRIKNVLQ